VASASALYDAATKAVMGRIKADPSLKVMPGHPISDTPVSDYP
jgi:hypothetical protein